MQGGASTSDLLAGIGKRSLNDDPMIIVRAVLWTSASHDARGPLASSTNVMPPTNTPSHEAGR
jgi:hypothetical protein